ncbi:hypothetical protein [uncultured Sunxiuqinia sp.]|uniref:hypothetical protein n=1 Tax=uncultured Sunxiuqinia sp. TaxID=1573825 RepID=UPI002AA6900C|nr:hypothetical protein [uncultured Sunxiuqinia sp.]
MTRFTKQGKIHFPKNKFFRPRRQSANIKETVIIEKCYCPNGHSLLDENSKFSDHPGIKIKVIRNGGDEGFLVLSPKFGDYSKMSIDITFKNGDLLEMFCPECNAKIPIYSSCYICHNHMLTLFTTKDNSYQHCVGVCQKVGCHNSKMVENERMISVIRSGINRNN